MDHVERDTDPLFCVHVLEDGFLLLRPEFDEVGLEPNIDGLPLGDFLQRLAILFHGEQASLRRGEDDLRLFAHSRPAKVVVGQVHDFLRRATAFDGRVRHGEQGRAALETADAIPRVVDLLVGVIAANLLLADALP